MRYSLSAILCVSALVLCGTSQSLERTSYVGLDGKLIKSNARSCGLQYKNNKYGVRPFFGFKITDNLAIEAAHEWSASGVFRQTKEGVNVSASATTALLAAVFEQPISTLSETRWFAAGGFAHTKIRTCESGPHKHVIGYGKATRVVPTATVGLKRDLGRGLSARGFLDWKGTNNMKIKHARDSQKMHTFKDTFGIGLGVAQEF